MSGHSTQISMMAGKAIPSAERQSAPNKEMNNPSLGIATANKTVKQKYCSILMLYNKVDFSS